VKIERREKIFLWSGACFLAALLVVQLAIYPAMKRTKELKRLVPQKEQDLKELRLLRKELESLREAKAAMVAKIPAGERTLAPLSRLDGWIERSGLRQNVRSMKPSPSAGGDGMTVEVVVEKVDLPQVTRFLYEVQSSPGGFRISRMSLKPRYTAPKYMDVSLQLMFYQG
jgi:type II secretory pathway component PulM